MRHDSSVSVVRDPEHGEPRLVDSPTKTGDRRVPRLDDAPAAAFEIQRARREEVSPCLFSLTTGPPILIGLARLLHESLDAIEHSLADGALAVFEPARVRIRSLPANPR